MNRLEFIDKLVATHGLTRAEATGVVRTFVDTIVQSVKKGEGFSIAGFGSFKRVDKAARRARNPATGETIKIPARKVPRFVPGTAFVAAVDPRRAAAKAAIKDAAKAAAQGAAKPAAGKSAAPRKATGRRPAGLA